MSKTITKETSPVTEAIKRLIITKDQKRVLIALADAGDHWTPVNAVMTLLGRSASSLKRTRDAMMALVDERLIEGNGTGLFRALPVERWEDDNHFTAGANIRWGY